MNESARQISDSNLGANSASNLQPPRGQSFGRRLRRGIGFLVLFLFVAYGILTARYYTVRPTLTRNYTKEFADRDRSPPSERAFETYRTFYVLLHKLNVYDSERFPHLSRVFPFAVPEEPAWEEAKQYCNNYASEIESVRQATELPTIGAVVTDGDDPVAFEQITRSNDPSATLNPGSSNPALYKLFSISHLSWCKVANRSLLIDARVAVDAGDTERCCRDLRAMLNISRQLGLERFCYSDSVQFDILRDASEEIRRILTVYPDALSESQLTDLLISLRCAADDPMRPDYESSSAYIEDWLQRAYSSDPHGYLTREGLESLPDFVAGVYSDRNRPPTFFHTLLAPIAPVFIASRNQMSEAVNELLVEAREQERVPRSERTVDLEPTKLDKYLYHATLWTQCDHHSSWSFFRWSIKACEDATLDRDATLTALALEIFRRRSGHYPATLDALVPTLLPALPIDLWDGKPLKYRIQDHRPLLYTIGSDLIDNGGVRSTERSLLSGHAKRLSPKEFNKDWVFMPHARWERDDVYAQLPTRTTLPRSSQPNIGFPR